MKENFIHVCFIVDESGSMYGSTSDVIGGFKKIIDEQRAVKDGECAVSLYTFADKVREIYIGKNVNDVNDIDYRPCGNTAMNDAIGTAITNVGKWLAEMPEDERPSKNLVVIMTDGEENSSREYTLDAVKDMIKHQTEKYNWSFMYVGADLTDIKAARHLGFSCRMSTSKANHYKAYDVLSDATTLYRCCSDSAVAADNAFKVALDKSAKTLTEEYEQELGQKITD